MKKLSPVPTNLALERAEEIAAACRRDDPTWSYTVVEGLTYCTVRVHDEDGNELGYL